MLARGAARPGCGAEHAVALLEDFAGVLQTDGYNLIPPRDFAVSGLRVSPRLLLNSSRLLTQQTVISRRSSRPRPWHAKTQVCSGLPEEGDGFEPSVPLGREVAEKSGKTVSTNGLFFTGDRGFESVSLQRRVRLTPASTFEG
jgi:hypothetical protein